MRQWFVTGAGTDVGKTFVTCALIRALRRQGRRVHALKPVVTGFRPEATDGDCANLVDALGLSWEGSTISQIAPWRFLHPLSPDMAARHEQRSCVTAREVAAYCAAEASSWEQLGGEHLFVEGVGGVCVPLNENDLVLDWIDRLQIPTLVVTGTYLGALHHTISTLYALHTRRIVPAAVIVSESDDSPVSLSQTMKSLAPFVDAPLFPIPRQRGKGEVEVTALLAALCGAPYPS